MTPFPSARHGEQTFEFFPTPFKAPERAFATLVFSWTEDGRVALADIAGRGWCIPSGRVEAGETSSEAARREAREEAGAVLGTLDPLGCYRITKGPEVRWADVFVADAIRFAAIEMPEESRGVRLATLDELPAIYYVWDALMERVFLYSREALGVRR